jgi:hypothetical protein
LVDAMGGDRSGRGVVRESFREVGVMVATNTMLFTSLDLGQWIADTFSLWTLPANLVAAVIATVFGLALSAANQAFRGSSAT